MKIQLEKYMILNTFPKLRRASVKLKKIRQSKNLTISALSRLSIVPIRTIENIERNNDCKVSTAIKLADALQVPLDELCRD